MNKKYNHKEYCNFDYKKYIHNNVKDNKYYNEYGNEIPLTDNSNMKRLAWNNYCFNKNIDKNNIDKDNYFKFEKNNISKEFFEENYVIYITRHMHNEETSKYWEVSCKLLREIYKKIKIIVIDDNSNEEYLKNDKYYEDIEFKYTEHIKRGELLAYYYFLNENTENKKYMMYIHDSVFIINEIHKLLIEESYTPFWWFVSHCHIDTDGLIDIIEKNSSVNKELILNRLHNISSWEGVFGAMGIISHEYLKKMNELLNINDLMDVINTRESRCNFERIVGILNLENNEKLFGSIHSFNYLNFNMLWHMNYDTYINNKEELKCKTCIVKFFSGR